MKGIERNLIVGIFVIILAIIIVFYFMNNVQATGQNLPTMRDFYYHCALWSADHYRGYGYGNVDMEIYCRVALGYSQTTPDELSTDDWENCRNACRTVNMTST